MNQIEINFSYSGVFEAFGLIFVLATINGNECTFIIDTGTTKSTLDVNFVKNCNIDVTDAYVSSVVGINKKEDNIEFYNKIVKFSLNECSFQQMFQIMDISALQRNIDEICNGKMKLAGLLGTDFLNSANAKFDFDKKLLELTEF